MPKTKRTNRCSKRRLFLQSLGLLGSSAIAGGAAARSRKEENTEKDERSEKDERAEVERTFAELEDKHGQPTIDGQRSFANGMVSANSNAPESFARGNAPETADELFSNKRYEVSSVTKYKFEDGVKKTVTIGTNSEEDFMVHLDGEYFRVSITDADRESIASSLEQLNSKMEEQIQTALQERYRSDEYEEVDR
ncbi:hypothetical protein [Natrinema altunense]|uniref:Uncharacterized protein n=1 Tax=Natrinema altunense TaxID=222984 RepID=A0A482XYE3_9EURY|nr:hypothetical protein [Natrinema altunense]RZH66526.1 hypothetical protein ELS17_17845 [Natrinema altunense]